VGRAAVVEAWKYLSHPDRHIRYAARIAIENQDIELWRQRVFAEEDPIAVVHSVIALARHGDRSLLERTIQKLGEVDFAKLSRFHQLGLLRAYGLVLSRWGKPSAKTQQRLTKRLASHFPASDKALNRELCCLLSYLEAPTVVSETIALMKHEKPEVTTSHGDLLKRNKGNPRASSNGAVIERMLANHPNIQSIYYLYALKDVRRGWTFEDRKYFFSWIKENMKRNGGVSYPYFMNKIKEAAIQNVPEEQKKSLAYLLSDGKPIDLGVLPKARGPGRNWQKAEVLALLEKGLSKRNFNRGKRMFQAAHCAVCHRFAGEGGLVGPDLSSLANRFSPGDILESISDPNKAINQFYQSAQIALDNGAVVLGQVIEETPSELKVMTNPYQPSELTVVKVANIKSRKLSNISQMPPMLIAMFNEVELLDFMAYVLSSGSPRHSYFKK
jgi:putative heme-binding domain-containing protein